MNIKRLLFWPVAGISAYFAASAAAPQSVAVGLAVGGGLLAGGLALFLRANRSPGILKKQVFYLAFGMIGFGGWSVWNHAARWPSASILATLAAGGVIAFSYLFVRDSAKKDGEFLRGAKLIDVEAADEKARQLNREQVKKAKKNGVDLSAAPLKIAGVVTLPREFETVHFFCGGSTGSGKSYTFYTPLLQQIRGRNGKDKVIVLDQGGIFCSKFFREGDKILNPFDRRSESWSPFSEMRMKFDFDQIAASIVPEGEGAAKSWNGYARTYVSSLLQKIYEKGGNNGDLVRLANENDEEILLAWLSGTPGAAYCGENTMAQNVRTLAADFLKSYDFLDKNAGKSAFSLKDFVREESQNWLFITYPDDQFRALSGLISCWFNIVANTILSLSEDPERRIWLVCDEFASLPSMGDIPEAAAKGRKYGASLVLGMQTNAQLLEKYGKNGAQTILANLKNVLAMNCADSETAKYFEAYFGTSELIERSHSGGSSSSLDSASKSENWSEARKDKKLITASEFMTLPQGVGFLKLANDFPACKIEKPRVEAVKATTPAFLGRDDLFLTKPTPTPTTPEPAEPAPAPAPAPDGWVEL